MSIKGMNHLLFSVSDLEISIDFYTKVFDATLLVKGTKTAYFDLNGLWLALNVEKDIPRQDIQHSYTHIAFSIDEKDIDHMYNKLKHLNVNILTGRPRDERIISRSTLRTLTDINLSFIQVLCRIELIITSKKKRI